MGEVPRGGLCGSGPSSCTQARSPAWHPAVAWCCPLTCSTIPPAGLSVRATPKPTPAPSAPGSQAVPPPPATPLVVCRGINRATWPPLTPALAWCHPFTCFTIPPQSRSHQGAGSIPTVACCQRRNADTHHVPCHPRWSVHVIPSGRTPSQTIGILGFCHIGRLLLLWHSFSSAITTSFVSLILTVVQGPGPTHL